MQLLHIVCESNVDSRIIDILTACGAPGYTRLADITGNGRHGRREGTPVWPGLNTVILTCVPDDVVVAIRDGIAALQEERQGRLAVSVFSSKAEQLI